MQLTAYVRTKLFVTEQIKCRIMKIRVGSYRKPLKMLESHNIFLMTHS